MIFKMFGISLGLGLATASGSALHAAEGDPGKQPVWKGARIARIRFNPRGDQRKPEELLRFRLNEDGEIYGSEVLEAVRPDSYRNFERNLLELIRSQAGEASVSTPPMSELYREFIAPLADRGMAVLALSRILDHEAMKRRMDPAPSDDRVDYAIRSILARIGADLGKLQYREKYVSREEADRDPGLCPRSQDAPAPPSDRPAIAVAKAPGRFKRHAIESVADRPLSEMYEWLRQAAGKAGFCLNLRWDYREAGLGPQQERLRRAPQGDAWPRAALIFKEGELPQDRPGSPGWMAFREAVRDRLRSAHLALTRKEVLSRIFAERYVITGLLPMGGYAPTRAELDELYQRTRDLYFRIPRIRSDILELHVEGRRSAEFKERLYGLLAELGQERASDFQGDPKDSPEARLERQGQLRRALLPGVLSRATSEFAADLADGSLRVTTGEKTLVRSFMDAPLTGESFEAREESAAFDLGTATKTRFPHADWPDEGQGVWVVLLQSMGATQPLYLEKRVPGVKSKLFQLARDRFEGRINRQLAYELLKDNPLQIVTDTCTQPEWPCVQPDARRLAEALFPEKLLPGAALPPPAGQSEPGSTLGRDQYADWVLEIPIGILEKVYAAPNRH